MEFFRKCKFNTESGIPKNKMDFDVAKIPNRTARILEINYYSFLFIHFCGFFLNCDKTVVVF